VIIASHFYYAAHVVVRILLVGCSSDRLKQIVKVLIGDREFIKQAVILEKFETKVLQRRLLEDLAVGKYIEIPLVKIVHQLDQIGPHPRVQVHNLPQAFLLLLYLVLI